MTFRNTSVFLSVIVLSGAGCSSTSTSSIADGGPGVPFPQIPNQGGPTLAHPQIVTVTFAGDPLAADVEAWGDWVAGSAWLTTVGADYGVGSGTHAAKIRLPQPAPATATTAEIAAMVQTMVTAGTVTAPVQDTVYMVYYPGPPTTTLIKGGTYCSSFSGYHAETVANGVKVSIAIVGRCQCFWPGLSVLQAVERTASHELIEAATNPFPETAPAYDIPRATPAANTVASAWAAAIGEGEVGDLCVGAQVYQTSGFLAQRIWSNSAAAGGADPCIPAQKSFQAYNVRTVSDWSPVGPGQTVTIPLTGWSTAQMPDAAWVVTVPGGPTGSNKAGWSWRLTSGTSTTIDRSASACGPGTTATYPTTSNGAAFSLAVTAPASAAAGSFMGFQLRSVTLEEAATSDATNDDWFHYIGVAAYVPPAP